MDRSLLFVPSRKKMLDKISTFNADAYILDLEDSIPETEKEESLAILETFLSKKKDKKIFIRLNKNNTQKEVEVLKKCCFTGYMLPKVESEQDFEINDDKPIIALVETAIGILNCEKIVACKKCSYIAFGAEDFTASTGMENTRDSLVYARSKLLLCSKAFGKNIYDTPSFIIDEENLLAEECDYSSQLGFDGKLAIHPKQVEIINQAFACHDIERLKEIIAQYEASGEAVLRMGDKIYEKMHINHFKRIIKEQEM